MSLTEIFNDSFKYPFSDLVKFCIFGVVVLIASFRSLNFGNEIINAIMVIIGAIATVVTLGYGVSITRNAIANSDEIPMLDLKIHLIDGIKMLVISIVYYIIPVIITAIVAVVSGLSGKVTDILANATQNGTNLAVSIPNDVAVSLIGPASITAIVAAILMIIFGLLYYMGVCRFAKSDDLMESLNILESCRDLKRIGIIKVIGWGILLVVIVCVLLFVGSLITIIPYAGFFISAFLISTLINFVTYRSIGLVYSNI